MFFYSSLAAVLPIAFYIFFIRWMDRYEREPWTAILLTFALGASISFGMSYFGNTFIGILGSKYLSHIGNDYFVTSIVAPVIEECSKLLIVLFFAYLSREFDNESDGLIYGAVVGLGFAFSENIMYFNRAYEQAGTMHWLKTVMIRSVFSAGVHACATGISGAAVAYGKYRPKAERAILLLGGLAIAVAVHSWWNGLLTAGKYSNDPILSLIPFFALPVLWVILFVTFQVSLYYEKKIIGRELKAEADLGTLPHAHIPYIKSYLNRVSGGWLDKEIDKKKYLHLSTELAFRRHRCIQAEDQEQEILKRELESIRMQISILLKAKDSQA